MSDYISRGAIKDTMLRYGFKAPDMTVTEFVEDELPAADVEPVRRGKWNIRLADEITLCLECSECGRKVDNIDLHYLLDSGEYGEACRRYPYCHCGAKMCLEQSKIDGFPQEIIEKPEPDVIPFSIPCTGNLSLEQATEIFKYRMDDETVPIWAKVLAIEKISALETLNGVTKDELQHAIRWIFEYYQFEV